MSGSLDAFYDKWVICVKLTCNSEYCVRFNPKVRVAYTLFKVRLYSLHLTKGLLSFIKVKCLCYCFVYVR